MTSALQDFDSLMPADHCVVCGGTIEEIGGRRLVATPHHGFSLVDQHVTGGWKKFRLCLQLFFGKDAFMVAWGERSIIPDQAILRALADFQLGKRPWFCQRCGKRTCPDCGELLWRPVASDYVFADGLVVHCPILGVAPGCWNSDCVRFRSSLGIRDVFWDRRLEKGVIENE